MGLYLDSRMPWAEYSGIAAETYFVDKSALLKELITAFGKKNRYFCITRPRRFGKSVMAHMVAAFLARRWIVQACLNVWKSHTSRIMRTI